MLFTSDIASSLCISIYVPLQRPGVNPAKARGRIKYMHALQRVEEKLFANSLESDAVREVVRPARLILEDIFFWRNPNQGLVVFLTKAYFRYYTLPEIFRPQEIVGNLFYIQPIMKFIEGDYEEFLSLQELKKVTISKESHKI